MVSLVTRIPAETIEQCDDWSLPSVNSKNTVSAIKDEKNNIRRRVLEEREKAKKISKETKLKKTKSGNIGENNRVKEEIIDEEIDTEDVVNSMSPEQLKKITEDAEQAGYAEGYEKGFNKAKDEGYQQGTEKAEKESNEKLSKKLDSLERITKELTTFFDNEKDTLETQMVDIICQLTSAVIKRELKIDSSSVTQVVQESLQLLANQSKHLTVYLHPQDIDIVRERFADSDYDMALESDDTQLPGGCRIDNQHTMINSSMNQQLDAVINQFLAQSDSPANPDVDPENTVLPVTEANKSVATEDQQTSAADNKEPKHKNKAASSTESQPVAESTSPPAANTAPINTPTTSSKGQAHEPE
ncbi:FliH/SctL family protein [Eionea flava]